MKILWGVLLVLLPAWAWTADYQTFELPQLQIEYPQAWHKFDIGAMMRGMMGAKGGTGAPGASPMGMMNAMVMVHFSPNPISGHGPSAKEPMISLMAMEPKAMQAGPGMPPPPNPMMTPSSTGEVKERPSCKMLEQGKIDVAGQTGMTVLMVCPEGKSRVVSFKKGEKIYTLTCMAPEAAFDGVVAGPCQHAIDTLQIH